MEFRLHTSVQRLTQGRKISSLEKCNTLHQQRNTRALTGETYKYLGTEESEGIQNQQMKERLKEEFIRRLRMILKSKFNAKNKITAIGALAVPLLRYSFGVINWVFEEIKNQQEN
jgi:hypothetical protein